MSEPAAQQKIEYGVAPGAHLSEKDAQVLGATISALAEEHGVVTPEMLVETAESTTSPIHHCFNWDDKAAAKKWREDQAQFYIRSITITVVTPKESIQTRAFHVVTREDGERGAVPATQVFTTPRLAEQAIEAALKELNSWRRRYAQYRKCAELSAFFDALEK